MAGTKEELQKQLAKLQLRQKLIKLQRRQAEIKKAQEISKISKKGIIQKSMEFLGETAKDIGLDAPEIIGSAIGTALGTPLAATPVIGPAIPPLFSALGQAGGELLKQTGQLGASFFGIDEIAGVPVNAPVSAEESRRRLKGEFASGLVFGGAARVAKPLAKGGLKVLGKLAGGASGVKKEAFEKVFKDPTSLISNLTGGITAAGKKFGELTRRVKSFIPDFTKEALTETQEKSLKSALEALERLPKQTSPEVVSAFALEARQILDVLKRGKGKLFPKTTKGKAFDVLRKDLDKLAKSDPNIAKADKIFSRASGAEPFSNILPTTSSGGVGLFRTLLAGGAAATNPLAALPFSPAVQGLVTAGLGVGGKIANPLLSRPGLTTTLIRTLQSLGNKDPNKGPGTSLIDTLTSKE